MEYSRAESEINMFSEISQANVCAFFPPSFPSRLSCVAAQWYSDKNGAADNIVLVEKRCSRAISWLAENIPFFSQVSKTIEWKKEKIKDIIEMKSSNR